MHREVWTPIDNETLKELGLSRVRFKGGSTTKTERNIPAQTGTEAALQNQLYNTATTGLNSANTVSGITSDVINGIDWSSLISGQNSLLNGTLPSSFSTARQQALNDDLTGTVGNTISNLGSRGILNSSVTNSALNDISQNASDTLAKNYTTDLGTYSGLLNNATSLPSQLSSLGNSLSSTGSNLFNTLYSGRMGTGSTTTSTDSGNSGTWQAVGTLGTALVCFAAGTQIATPDGNKPIEQIKVGDKVYSLDDNNQICVETVEYVNPAHESPVLEVTTDTGIVKPTNSQRFLTDNGFEYIEEITTPIIAFVGNAKVQSIKQLPPELVYDFTVSGRNIFFANGLSAEGWD
jgi:hypothetical protein